MTNNNFDHTEKEVQYWAQPITFAQYIVHRLTARGPMLILGIVIGLGAYAYFDYGPHTALLKRPVPAPAAVPEDDQESEEIVVEQPVTVSYAEREAALVIAEEEKAKEIREEAKSIIEAFSKLTAANTNDANVSAIKVRIRIIMSRIHSTEGWSNKYVREMDILGETLGGAKDGLINKLPKNVNEEIRPLMTDPETGQPLVG